MERYARIIGTGLYLPEIEVSNAHMAEEINRTTRAWAMSSSSSSSLRALLNVSTPRAIGQQADLAAKAAMAALEDAGVAPEELDLSLWALTALIS
jgi:3-oxoacyl-[acyl-carrier-protein] synthase III